MKILLTNDDGYNSEGINIVKEILKDYGDVIVCAPTFHQSGASMGFSILKGFEITKYDNNNYSIDGKPVDVVLLALQKLPFKFDLIVSGCNDGLNISYDTLYSGTIGAGMEALNHGIPSICLSTDFGGFEIVKKHLKEVLDYVFENKLYDSSYCLNINFPKKEFESIKGIRFTREVFKKDQYFTWEEDGKTFTDRYEDLENDDIDTDVGAVTHGYVSINPLTPSMFNSSMLEKLKNKV